MCGGTLVDQKTVVTASHCIDFGGMDFNVYLGVQSLKKKDVDAVKIKVVKIINVILDLRLVYMLSYLIHISNNQSINYLTRIVYQMMLPS